MKAKNSKNQKKYVLNGKRLSFSRMIIELNKFKKKVVSISLKGQKQLKGIIQFVSKNKKKVEVIPICEQYGNCFNWDEEEEVISVKFTEIRIISVAS